MSTDATLAIAPNTPHPFRSSRFAPSLGQAYTWRAFDASGNEQSVAMTLVELTQRRAVPGWEQYSLLFSGPKDTPLEQGTYLASNAVIGSEAMFATPTGPNAAGLPCFEVCVSRRLDAPDDDQRALHAEHPS